MRFPVLKLLPLLLLLSLTIISCNDDDPYEPDFSTVPEPFSYEDGEHVEVEDGVDAYILDEGEGNATVGLRDVVSVFITLRAENGDIIYSTSVDGRPNPDQVQISNIQTTNQVIYNRVDRSFSEGLKAGLLGMQEGERRTLIVSPEKGFQDVSNNHTHYNYRNSTLQYDIVLSSISY